MNKAISLQKYLNNNQCVTLPNNRQGSTLELTNKYLGDYEIQEILKNLGIMSLIEENNKNIDNKLSSYVTLQFLLDNFVKKEDIYNGDEDEDYYFDGEDWSKSSDNSQVSVDDELSLTSTNPIQNRVVAQALSEIMSYEDVIQTLREFSGQTKLVAGYGIKIEGNVISSTLDVNPFIVVNSLPTTNINPNKIYLVHSQGDVYTEYRFIIDSSFIPICPDDSQGDWQMIGEISIGIDLSSLIPEDRFQPVGDYITEYQLNKLLKKYVKKSDVYTPKLWGDDEDVNNEESDGGGGSSENNPISITIDSFLSRRSTNPVENRIITIELDKKQDVLTPGEGITIENGVISSTFNVELYEIVTTLPTVGKSNKIYLLQTQDGEYEEYIYQNGEWISRGHKEFNVDLTGYVKKEELEEYAKSSYIDTYYVSKEYLYNIQNPLTASMNVSPTLIEYDGLPKQVVINCVTRKGNNVVIPDSISLRYKNNSVSVNNGMYATEISDKGITTFTAVCTYGEETATCNGSVNITLPTYFGFSSVDSLDLLNFGGLTKRLLSGISMSQTIQNSTSGSYLWIVSPYTLNAVATDQGFTYRVAMISAGSKDGLYYYRSNSAIDVSNLTYYIR